MPHSFVPACQRLFDELITAPRRQVNFLLYDYELVGFTTDGTLKRKLKARYTRVRCTVCPLRLTFTPIARQGEREGVGSGSGIATLASPGPAPPTAATAAAGHALVLGIGSPKPPGAGAAAGAAAGPSSSAARKMSATTEAHVNRFVRTSAPTALHFGHTYATRRSPAQGVWVLARKAELSGKMSQDDFVTPMTDMANFWTAEGTELFDQVMQSAINNDGDRRACLALLFFPLCLCCAKQQRRHVPRLRSGQIYVKLTKRFWPEGAPEKFLKKVRACVRLARLHEGSLRAWRALRVGRSTTRRLRAARRQRASGRKLRQLRRQRSPPSPRAWDNNSGDTHAARPC